MRTNIAPKYTTKTNEGGPAFAHMTSEQALRRSVLSCLLWEREFYESGEDIAARIRRLANDCPLPFVANLAIEARSKFNLRHVPLLLLREMARRPDGTALIADTIESVVQRADEVGELLSLYWADNGGKRSIAAQVKKGLARAIRKFDAYQLAKYNKDAAVKLRDALFLTHPKPDSLEQTSLWKKLADGSIESPDTWEVSLSAGASKKETFERLIRDGKLGYLALLRNLRGAVAAGVDASLLAEAIIARKGAHRVLPFRYVAAARACPQLEPAIDQALSETISELPIMPGKTVVLVDVSGSMRFNLSERSDMTRMDAAAALASIIHGCVRVFTFSEQIIEVPPRRGMAGVDAVINSQLHSRTYLGAAVQAMNTQVEHDRLIVVTDEQAEDTVPDPVAKHAYMVNVASCENGVGYSRWTHIDGFSEHVLRFIHEMEAV